MTDPKPGIEADSAEYPRLPRAPIVEGLVDLRVRLPEGFEVESLAEFDSTIAADYPRIETQHIIEGKLRFSPEKGLTGEGGASAIRGYRRLTDDGRNIVQFRRDGFTFSRLAPYDTWKRMYTEAMRLWAAYVAATEPHGVTRLATRFINRINIPQGVELGEYIRTAPHVPEELPQALASFMVKYVSVLEDEGLLSNVTISTEQRAAPEEYPIIFDIDCFFVDQDLSATEREPIDTAFDRLHRMKNSIFFETLTPKALELFK